MGDKRTVSGDLKLGKVDKLWAVPSSSSQSGRCLKELAKRRMRVRLEPESETFDEYIEIRKSCWIVEQRGDEFFCDCPQGLKGHYCKVREGVKNTLRGGVYDTYRMMMMIKWQ